MIHAYLSSLDFAVFTFCVLLVILSLYNKPPSTKLHYSVSSALKSPIQVPNQIHLLSLFTDPTVYNTSSSLMANEA